MYESFFFYHFPFHLAYWKAWSPHGIRQLAHRHLWLLSFLSSLGTFLSVIFPGTSCMFLLFSQNIFYSALNRVKLRFLPEIIDYPVIFVIAGYLLAQT